jgi:hypothetical protein
MIFAREISDNLTSLVKKIDHATAANSKARMGSFVVFCNDDEKLEGKLKELADKAKLKKCVLTIVDRAAGPSGYSLAKDADITVVLYVGRTVKANHAFKKGEMKEKEIETILKDVSKIVPEK